MVIVRAPVRISFGGGGTDLAAYYTHFGGFVVSAAITRYSYVVARQPADRSIWINSADYRVCEAFEHGQIPAVEEPLSLPKSAIEAFADLGLRQKGVDLFLAAEAPPGTGLGSSSAMSVALIRALSAYLGLSLDKAAVADRACRLEIERLDMPIGKQDQYASAFGGLNTIEFTDHGVQVRPLNLPASVSGDLSARLMLFSTGQSRHSSGILRQQRADTHTKPQVIEVLHRLKALAHRMRHVLLEHDLDEFGRLLDVGWQEKKRLSKKVSSGQIETWYTAARSAGALGGKIAGAGGGGFMLLYVPVEKQAAVRAVMAEHGLQEMTFDFDFGGVQVMAAPETGRATRRTATRSRLALLYNPLPEPAVERGVAVGGTR
ncbi:MAG: GHMP kinase [Anaerolineae bacterium]|nr:GHMP kinase [Anaerolineae bacterium]